MDNEFYTVRGYELQQNQKKITPAMEDYIEMIYRNSLNEGYIRINQLAQLLNVKNSSASKMVQKLGELGFLNYEKYGIITITEQGKKLGGYLLKRHNIIEGFLKLLGCEENVLRQTELIEHVIDNKTVKNIAILNNFFKNEAILTKYKDFKNNNNP